MEELIHFLDLHSGSLTVLVAGMSMLITLVYVVATIFICRANIRSAEATRAQVAEARRHMSGERGMECVLLITVGGLRPMSEFA